MSKHLHIGNLAFGLPEEELRELIEPFGVITAIKYSPRKGFAFIEMSSEEEAEAVIKNLHKTEFKEREIRVETQFASSIAKAKAAPVKSEGVANEFVDDSDFNGEVFHQEKPFKPAAKSTVIRQSIDRKGRKRFYAEPVDPDAKPTKKIDPLAEDRTTYKSKAPFNRFNDSGTQSEKPIKPYQDKKPYSKFSRSETPGEKREYAKSTEPSENRGHSEGGYSGERKPYQTKKPYNKFSRKDALSRRKDSEKPYDRSEKTNWSQDSSSGGRKEYPGKKPFHKFDESKPAGHYSDRPKKYGEDSGYKSRGYDKSKKNAFSRPEKRPGPYHRDDAFGKKSSQPKWEESFNDEGFVHSDRPARKTFDSAPKKTFSKPYGEKPSYPKGPRGSKPSFKKDKRDR